MDKEERNEDNQPYLSEKIVRSQKFEQFKSSCESLILAEDNETQRITLEPLDENTSDILLAMESRYLESWPSYVKKTYVDPDDKSLSETRTSDKQFLNLWVDIVEFNKQVFDLNYLQNHKLFPLPSEHRRKTIPTNWTLECFLSLPIVDIPVKTPLIYLLLKSNSDPSKPSLIPPMVSLREVILFYLQIIRYICSFHEVKPSEPGKSHLTKVEKLLEERDETINREAESLYRKLCKLPFSSTLLLDVFQNPETFKMGEQSEFTIESLAREFAETHQKPYIQMYVNSLEKMIWNASGLSVYPNEERFPFFWKRGFISAQLAPPELLSNCLAETVVCLKWKNQFYGRTPSKEYSFDIKRAKESAKFASSLCPKFPACSYTLAQLEAVIFRFETESERTHSVNGGVLPPESS